MAQLEEEITNAGAAIIWVLSYTSTNQPGTAERCRDVMDQYSDGGYCVGDSEGQPTPYAFFNSPFAMGRGIDVIVRRSDMQVVFDAGHGTPAGNQNLTGADILAAVQQAVADAQGN